jgi:hypothetical protein
MGRAEASPQDISEGSRSFTNGGQQKITGIFNN